MTWFSSSKENPKLKLFVQLNIVIFATLSCTTNPALADLSATQWEQHYVAGRNLVNEMLSETGETFIPEGDTVEMPASIRESAATKMDQAKVEFKTALDSLHKDDTLFDRKTVITTKQLAMAEGRSHQPKDETQWWKSYFANPQNSSEEQQADQSFYSAPASDGSPICPICHLGDAVVIRGAGYSHYGVERHSKVFPTTNEGRLHALLTMRHTGSGCLVSENTPNMFCNRCDIAFIGRKKVVQP